MKRFLSLVVLLLLPVPAVAIPIVTQQSPQNPTVRVASPIADHMVLQHGKSTSVWGTASPDIKVSVAFGEQTVEATADAKGNWKATLAPLSVSAEPASLKITATDGSEIEIKDILVGEVWMCSGQSNMQWTLTKAKDPAAETADLPKVRLFKTVSKTAETVQLDCEGKWQVCSPASAAEFSAVGYHFGKELHEKLKVPIGLVDTSWGGKRVEAFTSLEKLKTVDDALPLLEQWQKKASRFNPEAARKQHESALQKWQEKHDRLLADAPQGTKPKIPRRPKLQESPTLNPNYPSAIYNQKVAPWTHFAIAGTIWYQGESNRRRSAQYESLLTALIEDWRAKWDHDFPFYIVQLANYLEPTDQPGVPDGWAELQYYQAQVAQTVPGCGLAVINDIGAAKNIHPMNKRDVGHRLALLALKRHYGQEIPAHACPLQQSHQVEGNHVIVTFDHVGEGLKSRDGGELKRFEIAGEDREWHWAKAEIASANTVKVSSESVPQPVAVRYAWAANPKGANLVNSAGLPASIFRTDDWELSTQGVLEDELDPRQVQRQMTNAGYKALFNGKNLDGWRNPYPFGKAKVVGSEIHLKANKKFFLVTEKSYSDFEVVCDLKLPIGKANSGIMFRCHVDPEAKKKVFGYQAECDGSDRCWSAGLYDESRRGWVWPSKKGRSKVEELLKYEKESQEFFARPEIRGALKRSGWNRYKITCKGDHITIHLNGVKVTDIKDATDAEGFIGIQHHGEQGQTYRFRNIYIKEL